MHYIQSKPFSESVGKLLSKLLDKQRTFAGDVLSKSLGKLLGTLLSEQLGRLLNKSQIAH